MRIDLLALAFLVGALQHPAEHAASGVYRVNQTGSHATIHVGKAGAFSFVAGHTHEVSGPVQGGAIDLDLETPSRSHVQLTIATADLKVVAASEPEGDAPKVQETMDADKVLGVAQHPRITFNSVGVAQNGRHDNTLDVTVTGQLAVRDVTQTVTVPVHVQLDGNSLTATGRFAIKQSAFGIKPISIGGVVAVKDRLDIDFLIAATK
jgi:polyisoprenoid-binding protein YceI